MADTEAGAGVPAASSTPNAIMARHADHLLPPSLVHLVISFSALLASITSHQQKDLIPSQPRMASKSSAVRHQGEDGIVESSACVITNHEYLRCVSEI